MDIELITNIMNDLSNTDKSLESALLKTKILASRISNKDLLNWCNNELNGYPKDVDLPPYRISKGFVTATYINGSYQFNDAPFPIAHLEEMVKKVIEEIALTDSVKTIESFGEGKSIGMQYNAEMIGYVTRSLRKRNYNLQILALRSTAPHGFISDVLSNIRSKLLDFILGIEIEFGTTFKIETLKSNPEIVNNIMNTTINNNGDGNINNAGANSLIKADIVINKGSVNDLEKSLTENGIADEDIRELVSVISTEQPESGKYGPKVNSWFTKMVGKAADGSWQIALGAAGGVLAEIINKFYGM